MRGIGEILMKKRNLLLIMIVGLLFITGCNKTTKCTLETDADAYKIKAEYTVTYDGNKNVVNVESNEVVTSDDETVLDTFETSIKQQLDVYKDLKYYDYSIDREEGKITQSTKINYAKLNIDDFTSINSAASSMFNDGKLKLDTILSVYKTLGAKCEE